MHVHSVPPFLHWLALSLFHSEATIITYPNCNLVAIMIAQMGNIEINQILTRSIELSLQNSKYHNKTNRDNAQIKTRSLRIGP